MLLVSCNDDLSFSDMTLKIGVNENVQIPNGEGLNWNVENKLVATVNGSELRPGIAGKTMVSTKIGSDVYSFNVTSMPTNNHFVEPCLDFGCSLNVINQYHLGEEVISSSNDTYVIRSNKPGMIGYGYHMQNGKLEFSSMIINLSFSEVLSDFISQRYFYVTSENLNIFTLNYDKSLLVMITMQENYIIVTYMNYDSMKSINDNLKNNEKYIDFLNEKCCNF